MYDKRIKWIYDIVETLISFIRILSSSKFKKTQPIERKSQTCFIWGNGPSLSDAIEKYASEILESDVIVVNQMAISPLFSKYKPNIYVLTDPAYWYEKGYEGDFHYADELYDCLVKNTTWKLHLYVPYKAGRSSIKDITRKNNNIRVIYYNKTTVKGFTCFRHFVFNRQLGMVRPQNVINAALMLAIYFKYSKIYLMGADMDWMKNIWVDDENKLRIHETHFYEDKIKDRVIPVSMSDQCAALYYTFKGHEEINGYASSKKIKIYNTYRRSFIDVFDKV